MPYGIYSFEAVPNFTVSSVFEDEDYLSASAGVYAYGSYYSFVTRSLFGEFYGVRVYKLDPETWESENGMMGIMDYEDYSGLPLSMTYDVKGEIAYALMHNEDASGFYWATMDEYGDFTKLADWADPDNTMVALACNKSGQIYGIAEDGNYIRLTSRQAHRRWSVRQDKNRLICNRRPMIIEAEKLFGLLAWSRKKPNCLK